MCYHQGMSQVVTRELDILESRSVIGGGYSIRVAKSDPTYDIANMDVRRYRSNPVLLWNHDHSSIPIGRVTTIDKNEDGSWDADFEFNSDDPFGMRVKNAYDKGFINGASVSFRPHTDGRPIELYEVSLVNVPADAEALRKSAHAMITDILGNTTTEEAPMTDTDIKSLVTKTIEEHTQQATYDKAQMGNAIAEAVEVAIDAKLKALEEQAKLAKAEADKAEAEKDAAEVALQERAERRADLLTKSAGMLPTDFVTKGKTDREIIIAALGDRLEDASSKSDDYLSARFDIEVENRSQNQSMLVTRAPQEDASQITKSLASQVSEQDNVLAIFDLREAHDGRPRQHAN